jgi:hypothetical protein
MSQNKVRAMGNLLRGTGERSFGALTTERDELVLGAGIAGHLETGKSWLLQAPMK